MPLPLDVLGAQIEGTVATSRNLVAEVKVALADVKRVCDKARATVEEAERLEAEAQALRRANR